MSFEQEKTNWLLNFWHFPVFEAVATVTCLKAQRYFGMDLTIHKYCVRMTANCFN